MKQLLVILASAGLGFTLQAKASIELDLLSSLTQSEYIEYHGIGIDERYIPLIQTCNSDEIKAKQTTSRLDRVVYKLSCTNGNSLTFSAEIEGKALSLVVKDSLKRKTLIDSKNTEKIWLELSDFRDSPVIELTESYYRTTRNLKKGQPIQMKDLEIAPVVERGRLIEAVSTISGMKIKVKVTAQEDGKLGEYIKVKNSTSGRTFYGKVLDKSTVTI
jgi:flagella basal body P-ring formation protein FlgA